MFRVAEDAPHRLHLEGSAPWKSLDEMEIEFLSDESDPDVVLPEEREHKLRFELRNADPSIANALRRIMIAEVPTVAPAQIGIMQNNSITVDEVLAHRIGLVPFNVDPTNMREGEELMFDLLKECKSGEMDVKSGDLHFVPSTKASPSQTHSDQDTYWAVNPPKPVHDDILLTRLLPGQTLLLRASLKAGTGQDHAKWSPVATAFYKVMPKIELNLAAPSEDEKQALKDVCPLNVFDIEDGDLVVKNAKKCTMCRECIRRDETKHLVTLLRVSDHFIFTIESVGSISPYQILIRAVQILKQKAAKFKRQLHSLRDANPAV